MNEDVHFRYVALTSGDSLIAGFALWFPTEIAANDFFDLVTQHFELTGRQPTSVTFQRDAAGSFDLMFAVDIGVQTFLASIRGIAAEHVDALRECLARLPYIFILAGYSKAGIDHIVKSNYLCVSYIVIDDERIAGASKPYPIELLDSMTNLKPTLVA